jgi:hypothetical protein
MPETVRMTDPGAGKTADPAQIQKLWDEFRGEVWGNDCWDSEFTPSPYSPGEKLRTFVDAAGPAGLPKLLEALSEKDDTWSYWGCVGLQWLGPAAGPDAVAALERRVFETGSGAYWPAAVALEAIDPTRARELGVQRHPGVLGYLLGFHLKRGIDAACEFIDWIVRHEEAATIQSLLSHWELRNAVMLKCPPALMERLGELTDSHPSDGVRLAAGRLLGEAAGEQDAPALIRTLVRTGAVTHAAIGRVGCNPDSDLLIPPLVAQANVILLADLLHRRRAAGWQLDPAPLRPLLREKLERPERPWRYEQHDVHYAALCACELKDLELIGSLLAAVVPENTGFAWEPLTRALRLLGEPAIAALRMDLMASPPGDRRERLQWMLDAVARGEWSVAKSLEWADEAYLKGRIEPSVWGAFRAYAGTLQIGPSAHAAFQLAWIDRAFGSEIPPERVAWIRSLGFRDEALLAELGTPVTKPLTGLRFLWDGGETQKQERPRAINAAAAGLPSLAAHWFNDEAYHEAARAQIERVRRAITL